MSPGPGLGLSIDRRKGVTLIELVVLIAVTGILAIYTVQSLHIAGEREGLAAERLASDLRYAQSWAMMSHNRTWVVFDAAGNLYSLHAENPANPGKAGRVAMLDPWKLATFQVVLGDEETGGVTLASPDFGGKTELEFDRNGLAYDGDGIALTANGSVRLGAARVSVSPAGWVAAR